MGSLFKLFLLKKIRKIRDKARRIEYAVWPSDSKINWSIFLTKISAPFRVSYKLLYEVAKTHNSYIINNGITKSRPYVLLLDFLKYEVNEWS